MRHLPKFSYCGLTIVMSNPSRFDKSDLLSAGGGYYFNDNCLRPSINRWQCDIRTADTLELGLLPNTKAILLLGEIAMHMWADRKYSLYTLNEQRGCPLENQWNLPMIASYLPQDVVDYKDFESIHNPLLSHETFATDTGYYSPPDSDDYEDEKHKGRTARRNWKFFLKRDTKKISNVVSKHVGELCDTRSLLAESSRIDIINYPSSDTLLEVLTTHKNENFYLDIETDTNLYCRCIGFSFDSTPIYIFPVYNYANRLGYSRIEFILRALSYALRHNTVVIHNSMFDLIVLLYRYRIPIGRKIYDTMLAHNRCFPEIEKSLGHCLSLWCWHPYHKDESIFDPKTLEQERQLMLYNAKDVYGLKILKQAIDTYSSSRPGVASSIAQVNRSIYPYLLSTLQGMNLNESAITKLLNENDKLLTQYMRCIRLLTGQAILPSSPKQCVEYFHDTMGYKPVGYTAKKKPSLGADNLYLLKLHYPQNAVIDFSLAYRALVKESGMLKFRRWNFQELPPVGIWDEQTPLDSVAPSY